MNTNKTTRTLLDIATEIKRQYYITNHKQNYGLRKALCEIQHSIDDIKKKIDLEHKNQKFL